MCVFAWMFTERLLELPLKGSPKGKKGKREDYTRQNARTGMLMTLSRVTELPLS